MGAQGLDKRGSFFKLIDTIASEIGELKREMVQTDISRENGLEPSETHSPYTPRLKTGPSRALYIF